MKYLATTYKQLMEEQKKAGIILDYAVYSTRPHGPSDPNIYLWSPTRTWRRWMA